MAEKITDRSVRTLVAPAVGNRITYDEEVKGFGVRITSAGAKAFILNYRVAGRERRITIGSFPDWSVADARNEARGLKRQIDVGEDPMADRHADRAAPTMNDLINRFVSEHLPKKRASTQDEYERLIRVHIRPALGNKRVADLRHSDMEALHRKIAAKAPYAANRALAVVSKMLNLAVRWEMRTDNPTRGVERSPEQKRERFMTPAEIGRLGEVLATHPERTSANAVRMLLLTGARRGETLAARWQDVDLSSGIWAKPAATTKTAKLHRVPLSAPALLLLAEMKAQADLENGRRARDKLDPIPWLFPGQHGNALGNVKHFWQSVCQKAGLQGVRVHDLRHTFASVLASSGLSLPIIGALLGHSQSSTTHRYAHLMDDPLRAATERAGAIISGAGQVGAEVLPLRSTK
jgi:integrase